MGICTGAVISYDYHSIEIDFHFQLKLKLALPSSKKTGQCFPGSNLTIVGTVEVKLRP
jgi:hypothetical protein